MFWQQREETKQNKQKALLPLGCKSKNFNDFYNHLLLFGSKEKVVPNEQNRIMTPWTAKNGKWSSKLKSWGRLGKVQIRFMSRELAIGMSYKISIYKTL